MEAGAVGAEIIISGKFGTGKGMTSKFVEGYLKHCGQPAKDLVDYGFEEVTMRPGKIGIQVKIMRYFMGIDGEILSKRPEKEIAEELEAAEAGQPQPEEGAPKKKPKKAKAAKGPKKKVKKEESKKEA
jgi:small subunit ribosomal protein S3